MPKFDLVVESKLQRSVRCQQLEGMFDVPAVEKLRHEWNVDIPIEGMDWQIGLIVGPSGAGKTQIARKMFGKLLDRKLKWGEGAVVDDFSDKLSMEQITGACSAVGFNTIPSWMKPFHVLSNGEKFRAELARRLLEDGELTVIDEFSSVVDRQVAKIASHAVQKFVRKQKGKRFVAVTCHHDVIEWLQPDWVYEPATRHFARGCLRRRPAVDCVVGPVPYAAWKLFAPYHYMSADLHRAARCWGLWVKPNAETEKHGNAETNAMESEANTHPFGVLAAFAGMLHRVMSKRNQKLHEDGLIGCSRLVTLPDFQGLGLAFVLIEAVASVYAGVGKTVHTYPAHPALIRGFDQSTRWELRKKPGRFSPAPGHTSTLDKAGSSQIGGRPCAVFRYRGDAMERSKSDAILAYFRRETA